MPRSHCAVGLFPFPQLLFKARQQFSNERQSGARVLWRRAGRLQDFKLFEPFTKDLHHLLGKRPFHFRIRHLNGLQAFEPG